MKLTLGQSAKIAKRAKGTLSKALNSGGISAQKDAAGRWQIDPSELTRWIDANPLPNTSENRLETHTETPENRTFDLEVKMLREQISDIKEERDRERSQLIDQIEDLRNRLTGAETERMRLNAIITDQRVTKNSRKISIWSRLIGRPN